MVKNPTRKEIIAFRYTSDLENRRETWRSRWGSTLRPPYCSICLRNHFCGRLKVNEYIRRIIARGEVCPDVWSYWDVILRT